MPLFPIENQGKGSIKRYGEMEMLNYIIQKGHPPPEAYFTADIHHPKELPDIDFNRMPFCTFRKKKINWGFAQV